MTRNYFTLKFYTLFACIFFAGIFALSAQVGKPFDVRYENNIKGDITFIGNNILNRDEGNQGPNRPYNSTGNKSDYNDDLNMQYIDIDNDRSTFSSSSATLTIPDPSCSRVVYAGLYWTAKYPFEEGGGTRNDGYYVIDLERLDYTSIKFRTPGNSYINITADEIIHDGFNGNTTEDAPYTCYKNITEIINSLSNVAGEYTVANVRAAKGFIKGGGSAGWSMVVVYENPTLPGKFITTFDGFAGIQSEDPPVDIEVDGFKTLPEGFPVHANMIVSTLEGDNRIDGDGLSISAEDNPTFFDLGTNTTINNKTNFFDSNITLNNQIITDRKPNSVNTLGFHTDKYKVPNGNNSVIPNDADNATLRLSTDGDTYYVYFTSFDVEIIEPEIQLTKKVFDIDGNDIQGQPVDLGQEIQYRLSFDNIGNDNGTNFTLKDVLPSNVDFLSAELPPSIGGNQIQQSYNEDTHELIFTIPDIYIEKVRDAYTININVRVQPDCDKLRDACSNIIQNQAFATYQGVLNDNLISDDPSVSGFDACNFAIPGSTNFLPNLEDCNFSREIAICGESVDLIAGANYDTYQWFFQNPDGTYRQLTNVISGSEGQKYMATNYGTYKVEKIIAEPCKSYDEFITVVPRSNELDSPITPFADQIVTCSNDGTLLPKFFLCGTNDDRLLNVSYPDAQVFWQKLSGDCGIDSEGENCPTKNNSCTWVEVKAGDQFLLTEAGEYRLEVRYQNNCFNRFYFKAYENSVDPAVTTENIICESKGSIDINNVGSGYEFAVALATVDFDPNTDTWQDANSFVIETAGTYNVYIRQSDLDLETGDRQPCLFTFENVVISKSNFNVTVETTNPFCNSSKGSFNINAVDARAWYTYVLKDDFGAVVDEEEATDDDNHVFGNLNPGTYTIEVTTEDGCTFSEKYTISPPVPLTITANVSQNVTCKEGNIQVLSEGGTTPHTYAIWSYEPAVGATAPQSTYESVDDIPAGEMQQVGQTSQIFDVKLGEQGTYSYVVFDRNNCYAFSNKVTISVEPPMEYQ